MGGTRAWGSSKLGAASLLAEVIDKVDDLTESLEVQQGEGVTVGRQSVAAGSRQSL